MNGYSQPEEYRFSHDSIELARLAARLIHERAESASGAGKTRPFIAGLRALDLCAGCGVVGLEFAKILRNRNASTPQFAVNLDALSTDLEIHFNEVQGGYREHFDRNLAWAAPGLPARWLESNYAEFLGSSDFAGSYDLVVSNPPYFDPEQGNLPPSDFKARARFFLDSNFETMWRVIAHVLKPGGCALVLVRDLRDHGVDREGVINRVLLNHGSLRWMEPVRGTGLVCFTKSSKQFTA